MKPAERKPYLKIGDVARLVGVSPSVIRSWESLGLTRPHRTASKYRLYAPEDVKLLKRARFLRKVRGLNAAAIVQMLKREGRVRPSSNGASNAIGVRLRQLRIRRGLSLAQVAQHVGGYGDADPSPLNVGQLIFQVGEVEIVEDPKQTSSCDKVSEPLFQPPRAKGRVIPDN